MKFSVVSLFLFWLLAFFAKGEPLPTLGSGEPGLKIIYHVTNQFVIYLDEPWTVGMDLISGHDKRHVDVLIDRNYGLEQKLQNKEWDDMPFQLYPFDDKAAFTCEGADGQLDPDTKSVKMTWPGKTQVFYIQDGELGVTNDVYSLARIRYGLSANQFFLGKIGSNIYFREGLDFRKVFFRAVGGGVATNYFELPSGVIDIMGVTRGIKDRGNVGFELRRKSAGFIHFSDGFSFIEFPFAQAKHLK
jgi:hypothetical protein